MQFGIPKELNMDNSLKFSSHKFCSFSKTWDILHKSISPHYYQSNGLAERCIQTAKQILNKAKLDSEDHFLAMLSQNSLPDWSQIKNNFAFAYVIYPKCCHQKAYCYPKPKT